MKILEKIFGKFLKNYLKNFQKIFELKVFSDISQSAAPYKHHICYGKSFKKFDGGGGGGGVACLIIVSLLALVWSKVKCQVLG